jgi:hypothetical protein
VAGYSIGNRDILGHEDSWTAWSSLLLSWALARQD